MLDIIRNIERADDYFSPAICPFEIAEALLAAIEETGMLPPMKPIPKYAFQAEHEWEDEE